MGPVGSGRPLAKIWNSELRFMKRISFKLFLNLKTFHISFLSSFPHVLSSSSNLDLRISSYVLYHCATATGQLLTNFLQTSRLNFFYKLHTNFLHAWHKLLLQTSHELLTNFLWTSYNIFGNSLCTFTSYKQLTIINWVGMSHHMCDRNFFSYPFVA